MNHTSNADGNSVNRLAALTTPTNGIPRIEELGLPRSVSKLCDIPAGLIVIAGPPGSGKRTTVAAMLERINEPQPSHVITHGAGAEIRARGGMRQDQDVVFVGELLDAEMAEVALHVAETGRLVFGTIGAKDAPSTITDIVALFPHDRQDDIRRDLANNLRAVVAQKLIKGKTESLVVASEVMTVTPIVQKLIREGRDNNFIDAIRMSYSLGMVDFTESLRQLVDNGSITKETALEVAPNPQLLKVVLTGIKLFLGVI